MADLYTIRLEGPSGDHVFVITPEFAWEDVERIHRHDATPSALGAVIRRFTISGKLPADTPAAVVTALNDLVTGYVDVQELPEYIQVRDAGGSVVTSVGSLDVNNDAVEELQIVSFSGDPSESQLKAGAEFELVFQARIVFPDANDVWFLEQERVEEAGADGLSQIRKTTTIRIAQKGASNTIKTLVSTLGLAEGLPGANWIRVAPSNNALGVEIRYTHSQQTEAVVTSVVRQLGGGQIAPTRTGDLSHAEELRDDLRVGLVRRTRSVEIVGSGDPLGYVEGEQPQFSTGGTVYDRARATARGSWENRDPKAFIAGKATRISVRYRLSGGGRGLTTLPMSGNLRAKIDFLPRAPWVLQEEITVFGLGATLLEDLPLPAALEEPWVPDGDRAVLGLPEIVERGATAAQHVWSRTATRVYLWDGDGSPLEDADFLARAVNAYDNASTFELETT